MSLACHKKNRLPNGALPTVPVWWEEDKERCNKLLNHPAYERVGYAGELKWKRDFRQQAAHLQNEWKAFLDSLPPERRAWFRTDRQEL